MGLLRGATREGENRPFLPSEGRNQPFLPLEGEIGCFYPLEGSFHRFRVLLPKSGRFSVNLSEIHQNLLILSRHPLGTAKIPSEKKIYSLRGISHVEKVTLETYSSVISNSVGSDANAAEYLLATLPSVIPILLLQGL